MLLLVRPSALLGTTRCGAFRSISPRGRAVGGVQQVVQAQHAFRDLAERSDGEPAVHRDRAARLLLLEAMYAGGLVSQGRQVATATAREARANGALGDLRVALACLFSIELSAARFDAAMDAAAEELELAAGLGRTSERREALGHVAWCDAVKGHEADCRRRLGERGQPVRTHGPGKRPAPCVGAAPARPGRGGASRVDLDGHRGTRLGHGRSPAAGLRPVCMDLVEALVRTGRREEAEATLDAFEADARAIGRPLGIALASRGRGLLISGDEADAAFADSLQWELLEPSPFERARTQLCWGEHLRRRRARGPAAEQLRAARLAFDDFGADLWAARTERGARRERRAD